jgi:hypothetical protein
MNLDTFYSIVSGINFTLLGLWWLAAEERDDIAGDDPAYRRMAYLVSLQFVIPGTVSLLSLVAPKVTVLWRVSFTIAAVAGAVGIVLLAAAIGRLPGQQGLARVLRLVGLPAYLLVAAVAVAPKLVTSLNIGLTALQVEAILLCLVMFLGVQEAWAVSMTPRRKPA